MAARSDPANVPAAGATDPGGDPSPLVAEERMLTLFPRYVLRGHLAPSLLTALQSLEIGRAHV